MNVIEQCCPPLLWRGCRRARRSLGSVTRYGLKAISRVSGKDVQTNGSRPGSFTDIYWDAAFAAELDAWGEGTVWNEIQLLLAPCRGRVLDIACGTGRTIELLKGFPRLTVSGCDFSDLLIRRAVERGIPPERLTVCDATAMPYSADAFEYSYSIGSLEHFSEEGIDKFIAETARVTTHGSFHQIPVSNDGTNHGWVKRVQEYYNNSTGWWLERFRCVYPEVHVCGSGWKDDISDGNWILCFK
jgi:SAM-dependent methyltransferase